MKRCNQEDLNTGPWWDGFWNGPRGTHETNPCPDVVPLLIALSKGKENFLDVGCGSGRYFPFVIARNIHGVDISPDAIKKASEDHPDGIFVAEDIVKNGLPYVDSSMDMVYCGEVIEHLEDPQKLVDDIMRVLKPGGVLVLNTPYEDIITADAHLWFFNNDDIRKMFSKFSRVSVSRFNNHPKVKWEHFMVVAIK